MFKKGVALVAGYGSSIITYEAISKNLPANMKLHQKIAVATASIVINGLVRNTVREASDKVIDDYIEIYTSTKTEVTKFVEEVGKKKAAKPTVIDAEVVED
jgi:hypothetical protein